MGHSASLPLVEESWAGAAGGQGWPSICEGDPAWRTAAVYAVFVASQSFVTGCNSRKKAYLLDLFGQMVITG